MKSIESVVIIYKKKLLVLILFQDVKHLNGDEPVTNVDSQHDYKGITSHSSCRKEDC